MNNDNTRYSRVAIVLHWAIAALILANLVVGFVMEDLKGTLRGTVISFHISSGITILALTVVRVIWRLTHTPPPHPSSMKPWERHAATLAHFALYLAMVLMPLTGWGIISANPPIGSAGATAVVAGQLGAKADAADVRRSSRKAPRMVWGVIRLPEIGTLERIGATPEGIPLQRAVHDDFVEFHSVGASLFIALLLLHLAAALKHQFMDGEAEFARMGMGRARPAGNGH